MKKSDKMIFVCDESGAKGYADNEEKCPGEVGVFAGILVPDECLANVSPLFESVAQKYVDHTGKLHIANLPVAEKDPLRDDIYRAIKKTQLPCFWYAIHVAGLQAFHSADKSIQNASFDARRSQIKMRRPRNNPTSLHIELFTGLYSHLIAFCEERQRRELEIEVRMDTVDKPIAKNFEETAQRLLADMATVHHPTGFAPISERVLRGDIASKVILPRSMSIDATVRSLQLSTPQVPDGLVLAADVLANSLAHLFHSRKGEQLYRPLNCPEAVSSHPLADHLNVFYDWGEGDKIGDQLYRHPKAPPG